MAKDKFSVGEIVFVTGGLGGRELMRRLVVKEVKEAKVGGKATTKVTLDDDSEWDAIHGREHAYRWGTRTSRGYSDPSLVPHSDALEARWRRCAAADLLSWAHREERNLSDEHMAKIGDVIREVRRAMKKAEKP